MARRVTLPTLLMLLASALLSAGVAALGVTADGPAPTDPASCRQCHRERSEGWGRTAHARAGGTCFSCHPAATLHQKSPGRPADLYEAETCADCHRTEYAEWRRSPHQRPVPYTQDEIAPELITDCVKCHNAAGFVRVTRARENFATAKGSRLDAASPGVTCAACHDPHTAAPRLLRAEKLSQTCDPCHGGKWQNLMLNGTGGQRYPEESYAGAARSPHNTGNRCVSCHMAKTPGVDAGGHSLSLFDAQGNPHTAPCASCHPGIRGFDVKGRQAQVKDLLRSLEAALKERNEGELPGFQPGKCNRCHRGGTEPFKNDPRGILEQAFQNYRFVLNDKSDGVHNPAYATKLLQDSLQHVLADFPGPAETPDEGEGCCGH